MNKNRDNFDLKVVKAFAISNRLELKLSEASTGTKYLTFSSKGSSFKLRISKHAESDKEHKILEVYVDTDASVDPTTHHSTYSIIYLLANHFKIVITEELKKAKK